MKLRYVRLGNMNDDLIGKKIITEGKIEVVYPIKEDLFKNYIFVDSMSPVQRSIYMIMDSTTRKYRITDGNVSLYLFDAPPFLFEGQRIRLVAKVIKYHNSIALKCKKII